MFETQKMKAQVVSPKYDGKEEKAEGGEKTAKVELILKSVLDGDFEDEVERLYFPECRAFADLTEGKERRYKITMNLKQSDLYLQIFTDDDEEVVLLEHKGVSLKPPTQLVCKDGDLNLHLRVEFSWEESLDFLKQIDGKFVRYSLGCVQSDLFKDALTAAKENEEGVGFELFGKFMVEPGLVSKIKKELLENETLDGVFAELVQAVRDADGIGEGEPLRVIKVQDYDYHLGMDEEIGAPPELTVVEVEEVEEVKEEETNKGLDSLLDDLDNLDNSEEQSGSEEEIKSELPLTVEQVSYKLSKLPTSSKVDELLRSIPEGDLPALWQLGAEQAFIRKNKPGNKVAIAIDDVKSAKARYLSLKKGS